MKTVLVTGVSKGLGLEFADQYSSARCCVFGVSRNPQDSAALQQLSEKYSGRVRTGYGESDRDDGFKRFG